MKKKIAIVYSKYTPTIDAIIYNLKNVEICCFQNEITTNDDVDLIVGVGVEKYEDRNILTSHFSLLPSFPDEEPVKKAVLEGVKVTGITFYYTNPKKIIAQYPIIISNGADFLEIENELKYIEQTFFPIIIEKVLNNEIIDMKKIGKSSTCSSCGGGCSSCKN